MSRRWLARVAIVTGAATAVLGISTVAWANVDVSFNQSLPKTASDFQNICDNNQGGTPAVGSENWVFNLPGDPDRDFVSVTVTFGAGPAVIIDNDGAGPDADGNDISDPGPGTSKAWITVPAGSVLTAASAVATGSPPTQGQLFFVVTHTCAGGTPRRRRTRRRRRTLVRQARARVPARVTAPPVRARRRRPATCRRRRRPDRPGHDRPCPDGGGRRFAVLPPQA